MVNPIPGKVKECLGSLSSEQQVTLRGYIGTLRAEIKELEEKIRTIEDPDDHAHYHGHEKCTNDHGHSGDHDKGHDHHGHDHKEKDHHEHKHEQKHKHQHEEDCHNHSHGHDHKKEDHHEHKHGHVHGHAQDDKKEAPPSKKLAVDPMGLNWSTKMEE